jgi:hypothetical protein
VREKKALTTSTKSNISVVEGTSSGESPLCQRVVVVIPDFNVASLGDEIVINLLLGRTSEMFTRKTTTVSAVTGEYGRCQSEDDE